MTHFSENFNPTLTATKLTSPSLSVFIAVIAAFTLLMTVAIGGKHTGSLVTSLDQVGEYYTSSVPFP